MSADHINTAAKVLDHHFTERDEDAGCALRCGYAGEDRAEHLAQALAAAGLLATPEHDAAVAAKALREADDWTLVAELVKRGVLKVELTKRQAGESGADA